MVTHDDHVQMRGDVRRWIKNMLSHVAMVFVTLAVPQRPCTLADAGGPVTITAIAIVSEFSERMSMHCTRAVEDIGRFVVEGERVKGKEGSCEGRTHRPAPSAPVGTYPGTGLDPSTFTTLLQSTQHLILCLP
jgi:hypothetical protein